MPNRIRRFLFGPPKDVRDPHAFHKLSLVALLAWVGLGADGLSSSAYGPDEAFRQLGEHTGLAFFLALATAATVFIISYGYSRIIEQFPAGGGEADGEPGVEAALVVDERAEGLVRAVRARRKPVGPEADPGEQRDE